MLVTIPYYAGDLEAAERLEERIRALGPYPGHSILAARDSSTDKKLFRDCGFDSWQETVITNDAWKKWSESPNNAFRHISMHVEHTKPQPWLWLEPDCCVVRAGWLDAIAAEYQVALKNRKVFMGCFVPGVEDTPDHMSGIGVYPGKITSWAGNAKQAHEIPWDIYAARQIVPLAHFTRLIQHNWRAPEFDSLAAVRAELWPEAVIYHKDKTGNLQRILSGAEQEVSGTIDGKEGDATCVGSSHLFHASNPAPTSEPESAGVSIGCAPPGTKVEIKDCCVFPFQHGVIESDGRYKKGLGETKRGPVDPRARIRELCAELKSFCGRGRGRLVRQEIHNAGIMKVPGYRKKRRRA